MLKEQALLKEFYDYLVSLHTKFGEAFRITSNELIDIRLTILVIKGYSKEYYSSPNDEIHSEFVKESEKYSTSIKSIEIQSLELKKQLLMLIEKKKELETSKSYSETQDKILNKLKSIQKDFENIYPVLENDILKVQNDLKEKIMKYGVNPTEGFTLDNIERLYDDALNNINNGMRLAKAANIEIKNIKTKIDDLNRDKLFSKIEKQLETAKQPAQETDEEKRDYRESSHDRRILIRLSKDKLKAFIKLKSSPFEKNRVLKENILKALEEQKIKFGILEENINYLCETQSQQQVIVAQGIEPKQGKSGKLEYKLDIFHKEKTLTEEEDGTIDFKEINKYKTIKKGSIIAEIVPSTKGEAGKTVLGETIPAEDGKELEIKLSEGAKISDDKRYIISDREGLPILTKKKEISVSNLLVIQGSVDYSTGNINFPGDVWIGGDILDEFSVNADGTIIIKGNVYNAKVESTNGDIKMDKGVNGDGNAFIKAKGNIYAKFLEGAKVYCGGDLNVSTDIMHSTVYANGNVICRRGKGMITGGYIGVGKIIDCNILGSQSYTPTIIDLGVDMKLREEQYAIVMELAKVKNYITKARNLIEKIKSKYSRKKISKINYRRFISIKRAHNEKINEFRELKDKFDEIENEKYDAIEKAKLLIRKVIFPKVEIKAGKKSHEIKVEKEVPTLFKYNSEDDEISSRRLLPDEGINNIKEDEE